ncbi:MAG: DNRLRE domain-containing protein [Deltaproteobacteria bacterium]|nr:DNRLRE domain-containing protein [Deltaproteobacteria bacterium]
MSCSVRSRSSLLALAAVLATAPAFADVIQVQPSNQDAFIRKNFPNRIAGANPTNQRIRVQASPPNTQVWRGLVQFSLAGIPFGSTVNSAVAELSAGNNPSNPALVHGLHRLTAPWLQSAVKWNNAPAFVAAPTATAFVGTGTGFKAFTVTPDVQAAVNLCAADHGWLVKDQNETASNDQLNYVSLEDIHPAQLPKRPKLTVDFTPPPCSTNADCADGNFCTTAEQCVGGKCVVTPVNCDDGNPCTDDICDCSSGCINSNICNDGFTCTTDLCDPGTLECTNVPNDALCDGQCFDGVCDADPDSTTVDPVTGCEITATEPDGTTCNDGDGCTTADECTGGVCGGDPVVCTALSQCHEAGTCTAGVCSNPFKASGVGCDDGTLCTAPDECDGAGTCVGGNPVVCTPLSQCHDAGTCNPGTGLCSNPPSPNGTGCDDADLCTQTDECDGAGACVGENPVVCTPVDQCHAAGTCDSGTGVCSEPPVDNGTGCNDGNACTISDACSGGVCVGSSVTCGDGTVQAGCGEDCDVPGGGPNCTPDCRFICGPTPQAGCRGPALAGKGTVKLADKSPDKKDQLNWKYVKGAATTLADFGDPVASTDYTLCVYDSSARPQPILLAHAPAGGTCGTKPCWKAIKGGFKYNDKLYTPDGLQQVLLKSGVATKTKILVKGKGIDLPMPTLPLTTMVTVQLKSEGGVCWETRYSTAQKNFAEQFRAKAD